MNVYKNLAFWTRVRKEPKATLAERINEVADLLLKYAAAKACPGSTVGAASAVSG